MCHKEQVEMHNVKHCSERDFCKDMKELAMMFSFVAIFMPLALIFSGLAMALVSILIKLILRSV
jgi:hypothetical protein